MSPPDPLDIIYEDDETDEGIVSGDGGTSLHGHPDHEHVDEDVRALTAENVLLRENVNALIREVERADAEMVRWRSRCRKIEDERDAIMRELDRVKTEHECRPKSVVVYSTVENGPRAEQQSSPLYRQAPLRVSPPPRFTSPRIQNLSASSSQQYTRSSLPSIAVSPTRSPTPPYPLIPTHRGRLAPPHGGPALRGGETEHERKRELHRQKQSGALQRQEWHENSWDQVRAQSGTPGFATKVQQEGEVFKRDLDHFHQEWERLQLLEERERNLESLVYSTAASDGWNIFDVPHENEWNAGQPSSLISRSKSLSPVHTPSSQPLMYPYINGQGLDQHVRDEGFHEGNSGAQYATLPAPQARKHTQRSFNNQLHTQSHSQQDGVPPPSPLPLPLPLPHHAQSRKNAADEAPAVGVHGSVSSSGSTSSVGSHDAIPADAIPSTPPDPTFPPVSGTLSPPFGPTGQSVLPPNSPHFRPQVPVVDPEFGPVIVHGPLPPRHSQVSHGQTAAPRRKREPTSVPPRHLAGGKSSIVGAGGAAFGGAAMGMGGGMTLALGGRTVDGDGMWTWGRRKTPELNPQLGGWTVDPWTQGATHGIPNP